MQHTTSRLLGIAIISTIAYNVATTLLAVQQNWASQFGIVGTDAGAEWPASGTAISAPLLPLGTLTIALVLLSLRSRWRILADAFVMLTCAMFIIGGIGEIVATPTDDTPRSVLVAGGTIAILIALVLAILAVRDAIAAWRHRDATNGR